MLVPHPIPWTDGETLAEHLDARGVSRREFLEFCGGLAAVFGLDRLAIPRIARALEVLTRPSVATPISAKPVVPPTSVVTRISRLSTIRLSPQPTWRRLSTSLSKRLTPL